MVWGKIKVKLISRAAGFERLGFKFLGDGNMAREFDRQVAELQVRAAVLNGFTALGMPQTHPVG